MKKVLLIILIFSLNCSLIKKKDNFDLRHIEGYVGRWMLKHEVGGYVAAQLLKMYLLEKGIKVDDEEWRDMDVAKKWLNAHKDYFSDSLIVGELIRLFSRIGISTGMVISGRMERAYFGWEFDFGKEERLYWYPEPRKVMALMMGHLEYFTGPYCKYGRDNKRILITFPSGESGLISPVNSVIPWRGPQHVDSVLVFFYEGKWEDMEFLRKLNQLHATMGVHIYTGMGAETFISHFISKECVRYTNGIFFLKDSIFYYAYPLSVELYRHPTDAILPEVTEDPSIYVWGERIRRKDTMKGIPYFDPRPAGPSFRYTTYLDVMNFIRRHKKDLKRIRRRWLKMHKKTRKHWMIYHSK